MSKGINGVCALMMIFTTEWQNISYFSWPLSHLLKNCYILFITNNIPFLAHFRWKVTFLHWPHIPDHTTRASACDLRAPLTYWRLSAGQTYSQPKASWYWDRTPGFHLSTREERKKKGNLTKYWHAYNENNFLTGRRWNATSNEDASLYLISK